MANTRPSDLPDEPYYQPITHTDDTETSECQWHPVSKDPVTHPPISSITVEADLLAQ